MPSPRDRASFSQAFEPVTFRRLDPGLPHVKADGPPPWPLKVALPLIAGLSLALWAGIGWVLRALGAG